MKEGLKKLVPLLGLVPLMAGAVGYLISGDAWTDCLYAGFALYFTNPVSDSYNGLIEFARWTAPLVTATAVLCALQNVWNHITWWFRGFFRNNVVVYTDEKLNIRFQKGVKAVYPGESFQKYFRSQIILFSSDDKNLEFYAEHKEQLKGKTVYLGLRELEQGLLRDLNEVNLFDVNGAISRILWKKIRLWKNQDETADVVIYGDSALARQVLSTGLQLNLFSKGQKIRYHVITDDRTFEIRHPEFELMNDDEILYDRTDSDQAWTAVREADLVIVADRVKSGVFQNIVVNAKGVVYYYSPHPGGIGESMDFGRLIPFGRNEEIFTDDNICRRRLIENAVKLNEQYAGKYGTEADWNRLSGFLKGSNISFADYAEVLSDLIGLREEMELAELEHIRWCRFYYLNYWKYADHKDDEKRLHSDLKPFRDLDKEERSKNLAAVEMAKGKISGG